jgi:hypothetical protein
MGLFSKKSVDDIDKQIALLEEQKKVMTPQISIGKKCSCGADIKLKAGDVIGDSGCCSQNCFNSYIIRTMADLQVLIVQFDGVILKLEQGNEYNKKMIGKIVEHLRPKKR